jgi:hypothetical protein
VVAYRKPGQGGQIQSRLDSIAVQLTSSSQFDKGEKFCFGGTRECQPINSPHTHKRLTVSAKGKNSLMLKNFRRALGGIQGVVCWFERKFSNSGAGVLDYRSLLLET